MAIAVGDMLVVGCARVEILALNDDGTYDVRIHGTLDPYVIPDDPNSKVRLIEASEWEYATPADEMSGLDHLEGKLVNALADGIVVEDLTVTSGAVNLGFEATNVVVGLQYICRLKTLYLTDEGIQRGTEQGKRKFLQGVTLRLDNTRGIEVGLDFETLTPCQETILADTSDLFTGDAFDVVHPDWNVRGEVCVQQSQPMPATVLGVIVGVTPGDTGR